MKYLKIPFLLLICIAFSCTENNNKVVKNIAVDTTKQQSSIVQTPIKVNKDTLQFIHFDGNLDYWYAFFLTSKKDTLRLVTDKHFQNKQLNKLLEVQWYEAGEDEKKYIDKRLVNFREINGAPFVKAITEKKVLDDINNLIEVKENADRVWVAEKPDIENPYFEVETITVGENNNSRLFSFRVYVFPKYEIKILDLSNDRELTLAEWRKNNQ